MGKSLLTRIDGGGKGPGKTVYTKKSLDAARMYDDANKYLGYVFKMCADFFEYHPAWLFPKRGGRKSRGRRKAERSVNSAVSGRW